MRFDVAHGVFNAFGDGVEPRVTRGDGERARNLLDDVAAWIADGVDGMAEADDDFVVGDAAADVGLGFVGRLVAGEDFESGFVGSAVLWSLERADGAGDAGVNVGAGSGNDPRRKSGGVELMLRVKDERGVHSSGPVEAGKGVVEQMKKVCGDGVLVRLGDEGVGRSTSMRRPLRA